MDEGEGEKEEASPKCSVHFDLPSFWRCTGHLLTTPRSTPALVSARVAVPMPMASVGVVVDLDVVVCGNGVQQICAWPGPCRPPGVKTPRHARTPRDAYIGQAAVGEVNFYARQLTRHEILVGFAIVLSPSCPFLLPSFPSCTVAPGVLYFVFACLPGGGLLSFAGKSLLPCMFTVPALERTVHQRGEHRSFIGGMWDELGDLQFEFMKEQGLKPHHRLGDVGCGALRGGVKFIPYLDAGNYYGLDINASCIDAAW